MHNEDDESKLDPDIQQLFNKYQNRFSTPLKEIKFTNLSSGLLPNRRLLNHSILYKTSKVNHTSKDKDLLQRLNIKH
jgi:hypothetical protein